MFLLLVLSSLTFVVSVEADAKVTISGLYSYQDEHGINTTFRLEVEDLIDQELRILLWWQYYGGDYVQNMGYDPDNAYTTPSGYVVVQRNVTPPYQSSIWGDFRLITPDGFLPMGSYTIYPVIEVRLGNNVLTSFYGRNNNISFQHEMVAKEVNLNLQTHFIYSSEESEGDEPFTAGTIAYINASGRVDYCTFRTHTYRYNIKSGDINIQNIPTCPTVTTYGPVTLFLWVYDDDDSYQTFDNFQELSLDEEFSFQAATDIRNGPRLIFNPTLNGYEFRNVIGDGEDLLFYTYMVFNHDTVEGYSQLTFGCGGDWGIQLDNGASTLFRQAYCTSASPNQYLRFFITFETPKPEEQ